jgi:hypothetical protein
MLNMREQIQANYPDIISKTLNHSPENYEVIDFEMYLQRKLALSKTFIDLNFKRRQSENLFFGEYGKYCQFLIKDLFFYQRKVGINGPQHTNIDDPVNIILLEDGKPLLLNGYHRCLFEIEKNQDYVTAYVVTLDEYLSQ